MTNADLTPGSITLQGRYAKGIVAILTAVIGMVVTALTDNAITMVEVLGIVAFVLNAVGVTLVRNGDGGAARYAKAIVAVLFLAVQAAIPLVAEGHIGPSGWLLILLAGLSAFATEEIPNAPVK